MAVLAIAGGVGGAKLAFGLSKILPPEKLIIAVNVGDDFTHLGLRICPDLDTVMYTLAGIANPDTGWGLANDTSETMLALESLGGPDWFTLGDRDLATHLERTRRLDLGESLSDVITALSAALHIKHRITPATNDEVSTIVETLEGDLSFQEYFVKERCLPVARSFRFQGASVATAAPMLRHCFLNKTLELVILCPSNPFLSISPILAIPEINSFLANTDVPVVSVSPIVGGRALKGPTTKIMKELKLEASNVAIARFYNKIISKIFINSTDEKEVAEIEKLGVEAAVTNTVMVTEREKMDLANRILSETGIKF